MKDHNAADRAAGTEERAAESSHRPVELLRFVSQLGEALLASGDTVASVENTLERVARAHGAGEVNIVALPTALFVKFQRGDETLVDFTTGGALTLRFDQIAAVFALAQDAERRLVTPPEAVKRLRSILAAPPLYRWYWGVAGHMLVTAGLALVLQPSPGVVGTAMVLGLVVGAVKVYARNRGLLETLLPSVAAFVVASLSLLAVKYGLPSSPLPVLIASLVTFLPGGMLAIAIMELAYGDTVSGSSRFVNGLIQLLFLALGMVVATSLVDLPAAKLLTAPPEERFGEWASWAGLALFAVGHALHFSVPLPQLPWLFGVLAVAQTAQVAGSAAFGGYMGGFCGALAMTPVAYFMQYHMKGPPAVVTFPPGLWLLVPGSLGLIGMTQLVSDHQLAGIDSFVTTVFTITAIALGSMLGLGLYNAFVDPIFARTSSFADFVFKHGRRRR